jgi:two-component system, chemotaxis family, CheB/CheR fusion protein
VKSQKIKGQLKPVSGNSLPSPTFPVAGIGAGAGGLNAFEILLKAIPENAGVAWVLVPHQHPAYESKFASLLRKINEIPVIEITNNLVIKPDNIYVLPPNKMLSVKDGKLKLSSRTVRGKIEGHNPINVFFESLAQAYEVNAIGVVLSGTASDGAKGLKAIKDHGGITMVQNSASAEYKGMPVTAINTGLIDFILAPDKIPRKLLEIKKATGTNASDENLPAGEEKYYKEIFALLHQQHNTDFTYYKQITIRRRILRRMVLNKFKKLTGYIAYLKENKKEIYALYQDMLIPVTAFFRDEEVFNNLCETVFPQLIKNKATDGIIRIWVAGCSTGQEVYSIAICVKEYLGHKKEKVQIFATDLSKPAIAIAKAGIYSKADVEVVSHHRLKKFFTAAQGGYQVNKDLRDMCVFAVHNFLGDPPFGKIDFISCRNVLIYMDTYLQKKALATFHYALNPGGRLILGKSENTVGITDLFVTSKKVEKIFIRKDVPSHLTPAINRKVEAVSRSLKKIVKPETIRTDFQKAADDIMLSRYTPPAVVVNAALDIVYFRGSTSIYLQQTSGKPTHNLLKMAKPGLAFELRGIVHKAIKEKKSVKKENSPVQQQNAQQFITLEAMPMAGMIEPHWLLVFNGRNKIISTAAAANSSAKNKKDKDTMRLQQLEQELVQLSDDIRSISDEQEAINDELQSNNEELVSSNEEMQRLNEELETSKEELQRTVDELTVVNHEMVNLNKQLEKEKDYAEAIIATIPQPMLVLNSDLKVIIANQIFYNKFSVDESQTTGRLVYDIGNRQWDIPALRKLLEAILPEKENFWGFEVEHSFDHIGHCIMRLNAREILRDKGEKLILLVIEDITGVKEAARKIEKSENRFRTLADNISQFAWMADSTGFINWYNQRWHQYTGTTLEDMQGSGWQKVHHPDHVDRVVKKIQHSFVTGEIWEDTFPLRNKNGGYRWFLSRAIPIKDDDGNVVSWFGTNTDVTEQREIIEKLDESVNKLRIYEKVVVNANDAVLITEAEPYELPGPRIIYANDAFYKMTGFSKEEVIGKTPRILQGPKTDRKQLDKIKAALKKWEPVKVELINYKKNGEEFYVAFEIVPLADEKGWFTHWVSIQRDITVSKKAEEQLNKIATHLELSTTSAGVGTWAYDIVTGKLEWSNLHKKMWGYDESNTDLDYADWHNVILREDKEKCLVEVQASMVEKRLYEVDYRIYRANDNALCWMKSLGHYQYNDAGQPLKLTGISIDITNNKVAEEKLMASEERLRLATETSEIGIWEWNLITNQIRWDAQMFIIYGVAPTTDGLVEYHTWSQAVVPEDLTLQEKILQDTVKNTSSSKRSFKILRANDGLLRYIEAVETVRTNVAGDAEWVVGTNMDVTERKVTEQYIKESEERYHNLIISSPSAIGVLQGEDFVITTANDAIIEIWGKGREIMGKKYFEALPELAAQGYNEVFAEVYKTGNPYYALETPVNILQNRKMELKYYNFLLYAQKNALGQTDGVGIIATEVTSQALFNKKIQESEENFRQLSELMPEKVSRSDNEGNVIYYNKSWMDYTGFSYEDLKNWGWGKVMHPEDIEELTSLWTHSVNTGEDFEMEFRILNKAGAYRWHLCRSSSIKDESGSVKNWVGVTIDIQKIKEEVKRKEDFLKMVSHELKTPITSIKGYVQFLLTLFKSDSEIPVALLPVKSSLTRIDTQISRLTRLITEMLDLSRIESGKLELKKERFILNKLVSETVEDILHTNSTHKINVMEDHIVNVVGDRDRLGQVLINYINNAIKYSPERNEIDVHIFKPASDQVAVSVTDFGIGISNEEQGKIFQRFYRVEGKNEEFYPGFGIGLFLCNEIIQRHGGTVKVESETGKGSVFTFLIPLDINTKKNG